MSDGLRKPYWDRGGPLRRSPRGDRENRTGNKTDRKTTGHCGSCFGASRPDGQAARKLETPLRNDLPAARARLRLAWLVRDRREHKAIVGYSAGLEARPLRLAERGAVPASDDRGAVLRQVLLSFVYLKRLE